LIKDAWIWPTHKLLPFHNVHPVTKKPIVAERWAGDVEREKAER
jgi:carotenoid cleavage dioxygenase